LGKRVLPISLQQRTAVPTVGNDSAFYQLETANQLRHYLNYIPEDFEMCFKVWDGHTIPHLSMQDKLVMVQK
jgi:uncharacterized protein YecE (DUF72 family)